MWWQVLVNSPIPNFMKIHSMFSRCYLQTDEHRHDKANKYIFATLNFEHA
jgi:hypothetical protein